MAPPATQARTVFDLILRRCRDAPGGAALVCGPTRVGLADLLELASRLATRLAADGHAAPERRIGLLLDRSPEFVAACLATWGLGGAFVPLGTDWPAARLRQVLDEAGADTLVATTAHAAAAVAAGPQRLVLVDRNHEAASPTPLAAPDPNHLAYVLFTSGSTGRPKGVAVEHRQLLAYVQAALDLYPLGAGDGVPLFTSLAFDLTLTSLFVPLAGGRPIFAFPGRAAVEQLAESIRAGRRYSFIKLTPSQVELLDHLLGDDRQAAPPAALVVGGEALPTATVRSLWARWPDTAIFNEYGPTEATVGCAVHLVDRHDLDRPTVPIGHPMPGSTIHLLDTLGRSVASGDTGEICIGGLQVARGYLGQPAPTAERFVPDPFSNTPGARLYRSGDLGRLTPEGRLEFLGRADAQVKIRGHRIEPGEVEVTLRELPGIDDCTVVARPLGNGAEPALVAYVTGPARTATNELRRALGGRLPAYMLPSVFVSLERLPLTENGKVDVAALPDPPSPISIAPAEDDGALDVVLALLRDLLPVAAAASDNFLACGGDSLTAARILARLRNRGFTVGLGAFFEARTIADLAAAVRPAPPREPPAAGARAGHHPLSSAQRRLWFLWEAEPDDASYTVSSALRLTGSISTTALADAVGALGRRHPMLAVRFEVHDGEPCQRIDSAAPLDLEVVEAPSGDHAAAVETLAHRPFDLLADARTRFVLFLHGRNEATLLVCGHHIVVDRWAMDLLLADLAKLYTAKLRGAPPETGGSAAHYFDCVLSERGVVADAGTEAFWQAQLGTTARALPPDRLRTPDDRRASVERRPLTISHSLAAACRDWGVSPSMALVAAFGLWLSRLTADVEVAFGTVVAGRPTVESESVVGFFANTLPLRLHIDEDQTWLGYLHRVRQYLLEALGREIPFARIVESSRQRRHISDSLEFPAMIVVQNTPRTAPQFEGLTAVSCRVPPATVKFPFTLFVEHEPDGTLVLEAEYRAATWTTATVAAWLEQFETLLASALAAPTTPLGRMSGLSPAARARAVAWGAARAASPPTGSVPEAFDAQAARSPDTVAVVSAEGQWTYAALLAEAHQLASVLRAAGVGAEARVATLLDCTGELPAVVLAILAAGGAWTPLDPTLPSARLAALLDDAAPTFVLTTSAHRATLPAAWIGQTLVLEDLAAARAVASTAAPTPRPHPDQLATLFYTSGSTGVAKAVAVTHRNILHLVHTAHAVRLGPGQTLLLLAPPTFDATSFELWGALLTGARLVVAPSPHPTFAELGDWIARHHVTTLWLTAALFNALVDEAPEVFEGVSQVLTGGEALSVTHISRAQARWPATQFFNGYGPTETTTFASCWPIPGGVDASWPSIPLGGPLPHVSLAVVDTHGALLPVGQPGELVVGGAGVARGYWRQPSHTATRFSPDPAGAAPGARRYFTGDLVRWRHDGTLDFLGRLDRQVKLRGFRVEPGEVEAALRALPGMADAVVELDPAGPGGPQLVAYLRAAAGAAPRPLPELHDELSAILPAYLLPGAVVWLDAFPRTTRGKLDRRALPPPSAGPGPIVDAAPPATPTEVKLGELWADLFGTSPPHRHAHFFALGGHSLLAAQLMFRIHQAFDVHLPVTAIYSHGSLAALGALIDERRAAPQAPHDVAPIARRRRTPPESPP